VLQNTATPATPTVTTGIQKSPDALSLAPTTSISYTVTLSLASFQPQVRIVDIFSSTDLRQPHRYGFKSGSAQILGPGFNPAQSLPDPTCNASLTSQITCNFDLANLQPGSYRLTYVWEVRDMQCNASGHNEVHLQFPPSPINWDTSTVSYLVSGTPCP
jgi:hypothetical protein